MKRTVKKDIVAELKASSLWINKIKPDCRKQAVFLTVRDNRFDLYHKGGKLFGFDSRGFTTHLKYASVITSNGKNYLTESELSTYKLASDFETNYKRIKENCSNYSGIEAAGVAAIYHRHSYLLHSNVCVLDIEVSFKALDGESKQDRIDILLYNRGTGTLQFVEAKHFSNNELWSTTTPKVIEKIETYESQIAKRKSEILDEYASYVEIVNGIFRISIPVPTSIKDKVTLLVFGFDSDQRNGKLNKQITKNPAYSGKQIYTIGDIDQVDTECLWNAKVLKL